MEELSFTFALIDLGNIKHNIGEIKRLIKPVTKIMAVVKADGYGHGAVSVSKAALEAGAGYLAVASLKEALEIRESGISAPVLVLSESADGGMKKIVDFDISQTVYTVDFARALSKEAKGSGKKVKVHIKVDTGMGRIGVLPEEAVPFVKKVAELEGFSIEGIFTHFSKAEDTKDDFSRKQLKAFLNILSDLEKSGIKIPIRHSANSAAALFYPESHLDMIRVGLSVFGLYPPGNLLRPVALKPALSFNTRVLFLKRVQAGTPLSYGGTFVTEKETTIATLPVGYADGLSRKLSNKGHVLIGGRRLPIVGAVCMDLTLVDVGNNNVKIGDEVVIIGRQGGEEITADEVARVQETINYEVICGIGKRVPRIYRQINN